MTQTTNYGLTQWEAADRILMENFNSDNAKVDAALKANADAIAAEAAARAEAVPQFVTGSFTGTGEESVTKHYSLGFRPKMVVLRTDNTNTGSICLTGLLITEAGSVTFSSWGEAFMEAPGTVAGLEDDGFYIVHDENADQGLNNTGRTQTYWAWK